MELQPLNRCTHVQSDIPSKPSTCPNHFSTHVFTIAVLHAFRTQRTIPKSCGLRELCETHIGVRGSRAQRQFLQKKGRKRVRKSGPAKPWESLESAYPSHVCCRGPAEPVHSVEAFFRQVLGAGCTIGEMRLLSRLFGNKVRNRQLSGSQLHRFD